ncbi:WbqC family protein [Pseudomonas sp. DWP3-1-2]|uniref:WbqC family protein n=1 Tax=Pseudomonas sp. DWP3-1-2 TaxID=2804645 RepID=UPI003CEE89C9
MINTLGVMQPYFFPYLGYFQLIAAVERGVIFDTAQYGRKSWMNRNRVLDGKGGWQYINVPVSSTLGTSIKATTVIDHSMALQRILGQLEHYRGKAPHYQKTRELVRSAFALPQDTSISELNTRSLRVTCDYLGLTFGWTPFSAMERELQLPPIQHPGQWALEISSTLGARRYINAPGGRDIFIASEWQERGIELRFLDLTPFVYSTGPYPFIENLSILDVLMWNPPDDVAAYIRENTRLAC